MRKFNSIIMSETEPLAQSALWLKPKKSTLKGGKEQYDIWYFGASGWRPMADYDTRYTFDTSFSTDSSNESVKIDPKNDLENGMVNNTLNFNVYDGTRNIQSSKNFVLESGLKKEIDSLKDYIDNEVRKLNGEIAKLSSSINSLTNSVESITDRIAKVEGRLSLLES